MLCSSYDSVLLSFPSFFIEKRLLFISKFPCFPVKPVSISRSACRNHRLAQRFGLQDMNGEAILKAALPFLRVIDLLPEGIVNNAKRNLPFFIKRQRNHAVLIVMDQVGRAVYGIKNPVSVPGQLMQPHCLFLPFLHIIALFLRPFR